MGKESKLDFPANSSSLSKVREIGKTCQLNDATVNIALFREKFKAKASKHLLSFSLLKIKWMSLAV